MLFPKKDIKVNNSIGLGYPGITYRDHSDGGYIEYIAFALLNGDSKKNSKSSSELLLLYVNKAKYAFVNYNETLNFGVKYVGGIGGKYSGSNNVEKIKEIGGSIGIGIEMIRPLKYGFVIDVFMGEKLTYEFVGERYIVGPEFRIMFLLNY